MVNISQGLRHLEFEKRLRTGPITCQITRIHVSQLLRINVFVGETSHKTWKETKYSSHNNGKQKYLILVEDWEKEERGEWWKTSWKEKDDLTRRSWQRGDSKRRERDRTLRVFTKERLWWPTPSIGGNGVISVWNPTVTRPNLSGRYSHILITCQLMYGLSVPPAHLLRGDRQLSLDGLSWRRPICFELAPR